jgi:hypothetical protein
LNNNKHFLKLTYQRRGRSSSLCSCNDTEVSLRRPLIAFQYRVITKLKHSQPWFYLLYERERGTKRQSTPYCYFTSYLCMVFRNMKDVTKVVQLYPNSAKHVFIINLLYASCNPNLRRFKAQETNTRTVCKIRGLTLLPRVGTLWRCGNGLFFELPPLASDVLLTTFSPLPENVLQTVDHFEIFCLGAPFSWRNLGCMADVLMGFHRSTFSMSNAEFNSDLAPCNFWAFPTMKRELRGKKFRSDQRSAARFREVGGAL